MIITKKLNVIDIKDKMFFFISSQTYIGGTPKVGMAARVLRR
jgi:hypothetical protein